MGSVKVLTIAKVVRNGDVEIVKKYAFVFPSNEEATVAALLLRLQVMLSGGNFFRRNVFVKMKKTVLFATRVHASVFDYFDR